MLWIWITGLFAVLLIYNLAVYLRNSDPARKKPLLISLVGNLIAVVSAGIVAALGH